MNKKPGGPGKSCKRIQSLSAGEKKEYLDNG